MAVVLAGVGLFLYLRFEAQLNRLDRPAGCARVPRRSPRSPATRAAAACRGRRFSPLVEKDEAFAEILDRQRRVGRCLDPAAQRGADAHRRRARAGRPRRRPSSSAATIPGVEGPVRILAVPVVARRPPSWSRWSGRRSATATRRSTGWRSCSLIGGPVALLLASLAGYGMAAAALRPVERMRRRAAEISASEAGARLPVPEADDELRRLGETLNAMLGRLEDALERERRFVDDASHELRTPLALHRIELELALLHAARRGRAARRDRLRHRRDRPADRTRRAAAGGRPQRGRRAAPRSRAVRDRGRARGDQRPLRRPRRQGRPPAAATRCRPRRRCSRPTGCASSRRSPTWSTTRSSTGDGAITLAGPPERGLASSST